MVSVDCSPQDDHSLFLFQVPSPPVGKLGSAAYVVDSVSIAGGSGEHFLCLCFAARSVSQALGSVGSSSDVANVLGRQSGFVRHLEAVDGYRCLRKKTHLSRGRPVQSRKGVPKPLVLSGFPVSHDVIAVLIAVSQHRSCCKTYRHLNLK